jgi:conjugal transfer pilus assembly protein TrbC
MNRATTQALGIAFSVLVWAGLAVTIARAQNVQGLDVQVARKRADAQMTEQAAFAREIARRGQEMTVQAADAARGVSANRYRVAPGRHVGTNGVDLDDMLASADGALKAGRGTKPRFIAFASLSMPPASLRQMMREVGGAGGVVVFRGFPDNSARQFLAGVGKLVDNNVGLHGVGIDPRLFRVFDVAVVPTYVVASSDFQPCDGFHCQTALPPFDRISGNVTTGYALSTIAEGNGPGAAVAKVYLAALRKVVAR